MKCTWYMKYDCTLCHLPWLFVPSTVRRVNQVEICHNQLIFADASYALYVFQFRSRTNCVAALQSRDNWMAQCTAIFCSFCSGRKVLCKANFLLFDVLSHSLRAKRLKTPLKNCMRSQSGDSELVFFTLEWTIALKCWRTNSTINLMIFILCVMARFVSEKYWLWNDFLSKICKTFPYFGVVY